MSDPLPTPLPSPVARYFAAGTPADITECFTKDAVVTDEQRTHHGKPEILKWREEVAKIDFQQEILSTEENGRNVKVTCLVSGAFKGSPAKLDSYFELSGDLISRLEIK